MDNASVEQDCHSVIVHLFQQLGYFTEHQSYVLLAGKSIFLCRTK